MVMINIPASDAQPQTCCRYFKPPFDTISLTSCARNKRLPYLRKGLGGLVNDVLVDPVSNRDAHSVQSIGHHFLKVLLRVPRAPMLLEGTVHPILPEQPPTVKLRLGAGAANLGPFRPINPGLEHEETPERDATHAFFQGSAVARSLTLEQTMVDLHGAPGAQVANNPDTGQYAPTPGFFTQYNYGRAKKFLSWMTNLIHTTPAMRNVGALEIVNEPDQGQSSNGDLRNAYYPQALSTIRTAEATAGVAQGSKLHITMMSKAWGGGDPQQNLGNADQSSLLFDDHRYIKWAPGVQQTRDGYLQTSCSDNRNGQNTPLIVGEWSLSVADAVQASPAFDVTASKDWYKSWFAAQARSYETQMGWVYWTWKANLGDPRWSYKDGVAQGIIPQNLDEIDSLASNACEGRD